MDNGKQASFSLASPTSGQWSLDDTNADPRFARVVSDNGTVIAELCGLASTVAANGHLLAAAKELLSLLRDAVDSFGPHIEGGDDEWLKFSRAAIAKATGVAPVRGREALDGGLWLDLPTVGVAMERRA